MGAFCKGRVGKGDSAGLGSVVFDGHQHALERGRDIGQNAGVAFEQFGILPAHMKSRLGEIE